MTWHIEHSDCVSVMRDLPDASVDAVITDPPYPEIDRPYGRLTEVQWHGLMRDVVTECRRVLKPTGSAVFVLQPNSERVGRMRPWLWEFMAWTSRDWNMVQDVWWWNPIAMPTVHCSQKYGLTRPSLKACVWLGDVSCYRNQDSVLWSESASVKAMDRSDRALRYSPSGHHKRVAGMARNADERGGVTPFNVIPLAPGSGGQSGGMAGHGAGTPLALCSWWVRYIAPPGGLVLDPFAGSGTVGLAAREHGCHYLGIEQMTEYVAIARERLAS